MKGVADRMPDEVRLLRAALDDDMSDLNGDDSEVSPDPEPPFHVDGYDVFEKLDTGGMGVVYRARNVHCRQLVALKMIRNVLANDCALLRFAREIDATVLAEQQNIVPLLYVGQHRGRLYYTMKLFDSSLARSMEDFKAPRSAARLIETIALAVQYAHDRGVLHLDLKPANILLDKEKRPHIADFGLARLLGGPAAGAPEHTAFEANDWMELGLGSGSMWTLGAGGGTPPYMAPEQWAGRVTNASDIYSLGVILLEMLTGCSAQDLGAPLSSPAASALACSTDRDVAAICRKCLQEDPELRYRSARELAEDLRRWLDGEPVSARPGLSWRRVRYLAIRQKWVAALLGIVALLGAVFGVSAQHLQERTIDTVQMANSFAALHVAANVLRELEQYAAALERLSDDPALAALVQGPPTRDAPMLERYLQGIFDTIGVYRLDGTRNARWPAVAPDRMVSLHFGWRDYFVGADKAGRAGRRGVYVARCILSEGDGRNKLVFSTPLFDRGRYVGVLMATIDSSSTLNALRLDNSDPEGPTGTLIGLKDRPRQGTLPRDYMVLVHEGLEEGKTADIERTLSLRLLDEWKEPFAAGEQLRRTETTPIRESQYRDPVPGFEDRWLAGMAQVGRTGLGVVVRTRYRDAVRASDEMIARMAWLMLGLAGASIGGVAIIAAARKLRPRAAD
jgi:eukaryotic-like serine/threonine-protein kinase